MLAGRYALSNMTSLFIGGIVMALSFAVIGLPFFLGYVTRCMREIVRGNGVLPEWDEIGQMFVDGLRMALIFVTYALLYLLVVAIPAIPVMVFSYLNMTILLPISALLLVVTMGVAFALFAVVFFASWVLYASTGSVKKAIDVKKVAGFVRYNPAGFVVAIISSAIIAGIGLIVTTPGFLVAIISSATATGIGFIVTALSLFVTIPWVLFTISVAVTFIYAKFYQDTAKLQPSMVEWLR